LEKLSPVGDGGLFLLMCVRSPSWGVVSGIDLQLSAGHRRQSRSADGAAGVRGAATGRYGCQWPGCPLALSAVFCAPPARADTRCRVCCGASARAGWTQTGSLRSAGSSGID